MPSLPRSLGHHTFSVEFTLPHAGALPVFPGFQDLLASICIGPNVMDTNFPAFAPADAYSSYPEGDEYYTKGGAPADANGYAPPAYRHLLAAGDYKDPCPEGTSQLFPISVLHAVHIMLFLVAATQILYSCTVLILCLWRVRDSCTHLAAFLYLMMCAFCCMSKAGQAPRRHSPLFLLAC